MNTCPLCGNPRLETIVCGDTEPPRKHVKGEPIPTCVFPVFQNHNRFSWKACGKPAVIVDAFFPAEWEHNRCAFHASKEFQDESFDPCI